jgi:uncharacterized protein (UPF0248 family)
MANVIGRPRLRPSRDIFFQLKWDQDLNADTYTVGYEDRFLGTQEISIAEFRPETSHRGFEYDIPFHRVYYFRRDRDNLVVWDRRNRVDLLK